MKFIIKMAAMFGVINLANFLRIIAEQLDLDPILPFLPFFLAGVASVEIYRFLDRKIT